jgi:hypothetical protein
MSGTHIYFHMQANGDNYLSRVLKLLRSDLQYISELLIEERIYILTRFELPFPAASSSRTPGSYCNVYRGSNEPFPIWDKCQYLQVSDSGPYFLIFLSSFLEPLPGVELDSLTVSLDNDI